MVVPKEGDQFIGALDQYGNRLTVMTGAQPLRDFGRDQFGNYVAATNQFQPGQQTGACVPGFPRCTFPEDFFYDNQPYVHAGSAGPSLAPGQYFFDYPAGLIYFRPRNPGDNPAEHNVEYSRTRVAFTGAHASDVVIRNLVVEKYAIPDQFGAIGDQYPGRGWIVRNNETRWNHGQGIRIGTDGQVLGNFTHDNGQMGMGGSGSNILLEGNEIAHNVTYNGTDCGFECGGFKFAHTDGLVVRRNNCHDNAGPGMWTDISSIHVLYEENTVIFNSGPGIFHETSYDAVIRNNTIIGNGSPAPDDWFWNAQIQISTSQNLDIYGNVIVVDTRNNGNGIMLLQQDRTRDPCNFGPCRVANTAVHDNTIIVSGLRWHGTTGGAQDYVGQGDMFAPSSNNRFYRNQYFVPDTQSAAYWEWANSRQSMNGFRLFGHEAEGAALSNLIP